MKMTMNRNVTIRTLLGHVIRFRKGEPKVVPANCITICMEKGAVPVNGEEVPAPLDIQKGVEPQGLDRIPHIKKAVEQMVSRNRRHDFNADSRPNLKTVSEIVGFRVSSQEVGVIFDEIMAPADE